MFSIFFWSVCRRRNASFLAVDTPAVVSVLGTRSKDFRIPWIAALVVAAFCAIMLASCYHWWCKPTATGESQPLNLQRRGLPSKAREEQKPSRRHSSSLRRLSSRDSPNGWSLNFTSFFLLDDDVGSHILAQLMLACCRTCITWWISLCTWSLWGCTRGDALAAARCALLPLEDSKDSILTTFQLASRTASTTTVRTSS